MQVVENAYLQGYQDTKRKDKGHVNIGEKAALFAT